MANRRRNAGVTQTATYHHGSHPSEIAQPAHNAFHSIPQANYEQSSWTSGNFVHPDPAADNSYDSVMAPPPATLTLTVPGNGSYTANSLLYSPSSDGYPQSQGQEQYSLPSYGGSLLDGGNNNGWPVKLDPALSPLYNSKLSPSEPSPKAHFDSSYDAEVKIKDMSPSPQQQAATSNMSPKQRAAHRKAIEEKSSMKRKLAEQRLSRAITNRLGGTFVPGLANQMNQAADIIERDSRTIQMLEAELSRLRKGGNLNADVQMKYH